MFRLSQAHLNLLQVCPPKFKQSYLTQVSSLPNPDTEEKQTWGSRFHLLMQQRELGLPIEPLLEEDTELGKSLKALIQVAPELLINNKNQKRAAEHSRTLSYGNYLLTVIYDLLIAEEKQAKIIDWKTYPKPEEKEKLAKKLAKNWQTRLYLYVLAETSDYLPEQISMTYWFVKLPQKPQSHTFFYNQEQHQEIKQDLTDLLNQLTSWRRESSDKSFPHRKDCQQNCPYFSELLSRSESNINSELLFDLQQIKEIPI